MRTFSAMARLLSHLGEQLISSPTVAILELIKNAYDADSSVVKINIDQKKKIMTIEDNGHGMTENDILEKYLVIGTPDRLLTKENIRTKNERNTKVPLGEKGLGRFATMKLGNKIVLFTKSKESNFASLLLINWGKFNYSSKSKLEDAKVHLYRVQLKDIPATYSESFVKIKIYDLKDFCDTEEWDYKEFETFYRGNFLKYLNPFSPNMGFQIKFEVKTHFGQFYRFTPQNIDNALLQQAPYKIKGEVVGKMLRSEYYIRGEDGNEYSGKYDKKIIELEGVSYEEDEQVGPVMFEFYFFNRTPARLREIKGFEDIKEIRRLLDQYCGGIMIYRDNFRVLPYAEPGNDWLELDSSSQFRSSGIRFNTVQTVGTIYISSMQNPNLRDQTNREGLVHNKAYQHLKTILKAILKDFKYLIQGYYPQKAIKKGPIETDDIREAVEPFAQRISTLKVEVERLATYDSVIDKKTLHDTLQILRENIGFADTQLNQVKLNLSELDERIKEVENQQKMIFDLAGMGMTAETTAHEMKSYLGRLNSYLVNLHKKMPLEKETISTLLHNTRALELLVSRIDIQSITKRRTKSTLDLIGVVSDVIKSKEKVWEIDGQSNIEISLSYEDKCYIDANQGMIVQVLDNLLNNSHYWVLNHQKEINKTKRVSFSGMITINISNDGIIEFSDNGIGIHQSDAKYIFEPFFSRKEDGRGLGLYIVSQILNFHEAEISLSNEQNDYGNYFKFIVDFSRCITNLKLQEKNE